MKEKTRGFLLRWFERLDRRNILRILSDKAYLKILFKLRLNKSLNLKNPKTFNEKLQWLKLYDRKPIYTTMVDKYQAKEYVANIIGDEYIIPTLGVWDRFDDIDFDSLPNQFVLKCTHDSGGLVICRDKSTLDKAAAKQKIEKSLKVNYYWRGREWPYKNVKPRIIAEKFLDDGSGDAIYDYKFFCFNGVPKIMYLSRDKSKEPRTDFFDMSYNHLNMRMRDLNADVLPEKPECFEEMKHLAAVLSKDIPHVRVDFYMVNKKIYIGEMTFFHCGGFVQVKPEEWNSTMGDWIQLPQE